MLDNESKKQLLQPEALTNAPSKPWVVPKLTVIEMKTTLKFTSGSYLDHLDSPISYHY